MHVGILTAPLRNKPLSEVIPWAAEHGIKALEIQTRTGSHLDPATVDDNQIEQIHQLLNTHGVSISCLACYANMTGVSDEQATQNQRAVEQAIRLAARMGVDTVGTLAGFPAPGKNRMKTVNDGSCWCVPPTA